MPGAATRSRSSPPPAGDMTAVLSAFFLSHTDSPPFAPPLSRRSRAVSQPRPIGAGGTKTTEGAPVTFKVSLFQPFIATRPMALYPTYFQSLAYALVGLARCADLG